MKQTSLLTSHRSSTRRALLKTGPASAPAGVAMPRLTQPVSANTFDDSAHAPSIAWQQAEDGGGLSESGLERLHEIMAGHVADGEAPGLVTLVSRRGDTHVDAIGMKAFDGNEPMERDTIFRMASMTKPIAAVAAMILVEDCVLR